jgi:hypothetical protein
MHRYESYHDWVTIQTLTGSYANGETNSGVIQVDDFNQLTLIVDYKTGAGETANTLYLKVEASVDPDETFFAPLTTEATSAGVVTLSTRQYTVAGALAATNYYAAIEIPINARFVRITVYESGVVTNYGTVSIDYIARSDV